ncbi:MAG: histidine phosphatase family protein [Dehalococcoidia bacterium]|nr:histidine phosphatase family protein [Dehalococcoidia bacterium]
MPHTRVLIARHGETYGNIDQLFCGHSETELTPRGIAQARALGDRLAEETIDAAYASDLSRAAETARHILRERTVPLALEPRLREMHYGDWEARPGKELYEAHPELLREFAECRSVPPNGETIEGLRVRTAGAVRDVVMRHQGATLLLVSHGNAIMAMLSELLGMPHSATWSFWFDNASLTTLRFSENGRVVMVAGNDTAHTRHLVEPTPAHLIL